MPHDELLAGALAAAAAGSAVLRRYFGGADLDVRTKAPHDFVTRADRESEEATVAEIRRRFPDHRIVGEEGGERPGGAGELCWILDPLDGTTNFLQGLPVFAISVACVAGERSLVGVVGEPMAGKVFHASRGGGAWCDGGPLRVSARSELAGSFLATGYPFKAYGALDHYLGALRDALLVARAVRRCGAAALDLAYTASGVYDGFFEFRLAPWDLAAGALLIEEAGGVVTDLEGGNDFLFRGNVVAGAPAVQAALLSLVRRHADDALLDRLVPRAV